MKTLLTVREWMDNPGDMKQVQIDDCDYTTFLMIKTAFHCLGLSQYIEMEYIDNKAFIKTYEYKK